MLFFILVESVFPGVWVPDYIFRCFREEIETSVERSNPEFKMLVKKDCTAPRLSRKSL